MSKQESTASMSDKGVSIEQRRQNVSGKVFSFAKYLLARLDRISLTYLWQSEETLMINLLDHKSFPSMTNWGCCFDIGVCVGYKQGATRQLRRIPFVQVIIIIVVRLKKVWVGKKPKSGKGNLPDEVVDCQQEQRQWGFALRSHRPCLKMTGYLFVIASPCNSVFSFNHALLTERKDSVNGTGLGFMVWGEALKIL